MFFPLTAEVLWMLPWFPHLTRPATASLHSIPKGPKGGPGVLHLTASKSRGPTRALEELGAVEVGETNETLEQTGGQRKPGHGSCSVIALRLEPPFAWSPPKDQRLTRMVRLRGQAPPLLPKRSYRLRTRAASDKMESSWGW